MFTHDFVLSVLSDEGRVLKETGKGIVEVDSGKGYVVRLRNKHRLSCLVEVLVDGISIVEKGKIVLMGNDYSDIMGIVGGERFKTVKGKQYIEVKFYLQDEEVEDKYGISKRPIYIQESEGSNPKLSMFPPSWYNTIQPDKKTIGISQNQVVFTENGSVSLGSIMDDTMDVSSMVQDGAITSTNDIYSSVGIGFSQIKFEKEPTIMKMIVKGK